MGWRTNTAPQAQIAADTEKHNGSACGTKEVVEEERGCLEAQSRAWLRDTSPFCPWVSAEHQDLALLPGLGLCCTNSDHERRGISAPAPGLGQAASP